MPHSSYAGLLEATGFYRNGRPIPDLVWSGASLLQAVQKQGPNSQRLDRALRYSAVIRPEEQNGRLGVTDIFELSGSPCIYFKNLDSDLQGRELTTRLLNWQRAAWNHGQAPLLWVVTPSEVHILNAYAQPPKADDTSGIEVAQFKLIADGLAQLRQVATREHFQTGRFWHDTGCEIDRSARVDRQLVRDVLSSVTRLESLGLAKGDAHRLVLQTIFAAYLHARGWLSSRRLEYLVRVKTLQEALASTSAAKTLFGWLQSTFNGDVFPETSKAYYTREQLHELHFLLVGGDPATRQHYLSPYDFGILPVELFSAIYDRFTHSIDQVAAEEHGAHYTPLNLVHLLLDEVLADHAFPTPLPEAPRVLDLACGSGVFLVECFRRLLARRLIRGEALSRHLIRDVLYNQIFGVDIMEGAVQIAAVSLYLAALEVDPSPGNIDSVRFLPLRPGTANDHHPRPFYNLHAADSFDDSGTFATTEPFANRHFDLVIGNPPWTTRKGGSVKAYASSRRIPLARNSPPDQAFCWRALDFCGDKARIALVLDSHRFFAHYRVSFDAKQAIFKAIPPRYLINFSELRLEELFPSVNGGKPCGPALIYIGQPRPSVGYRDCFVVQVEWSDTFKNTGLFTIGPECVRRVSLDRLIGEHTTLKCALFGGARDAALVRRLQHTFNPLRESWVPPFRCGEGFQRSHGKKQPPWIYDLPLLPSTPSTPFRFSVRSTNFSRVPRDWSFLNPREQAIYTAPLLIAPQAFKAAIGYGAFVAESSCAYSEQYFGFVVPRSKADTLHLLNGILNSSLAQYLLFFLGSFVGVYQPKLEPNDLLALPVPDLAGESKAAQQVLAAEAIATAETARGNEVSERALAQLNGAVFDYYGLDADERIFVTDFVRDVIPSHLDRKFNKPRACPDNAQLAEYAASFIRVADAFLSPRTPSRLVARIFGADASIPLRIVKFELGHRSDSIRPVEIVYREELNPLLERIASLLPSRERGALAIRRVLRVYGQGELYVVKPSESRFWTASAGINDADAVLAEHWATYI